VPWRFRRFSLFQSLMAATPSSVMYSAKYRLQSVMPRRFLIWGLTLGACFRLS